MSSREIIVEQYWIADNMYYASRHAGDRIAAMRWAIVCDTLASLM